MPQTSTAIADLSPPSRPRASRVRDRVPDPQTLLLDHIGSLRRLIRRAGKRSRLDPSDIEDFGSWVTVRILRQDYAILRAFRGACAPAECRRGTCAFNGFLAAVVRNLMRDYRNHLWGKWRPSAAASRLGEVAVALERLIHRNGLPCQEAIEILHSRSNGRIDRTALQEVAEQLPVRWRRRHEPLGELPAQASAEPGHRLEEAEKKAKLRDVLTILRDTLQDLSERDRRLLSLHFAKGETVAQISRRLRDHQRSVYSRRDRCLRRLKQKLLERGLDWPEIRALLGVDLPDADQLVWPTRDAG